MPPPRALSLSSALSAREAAERDARELARKVQLLQVLQDAVDAIPPPPAAASLPPGADDLHEAVPDDAARTWSEHQILKHFGRRISYRIDNYLPSSSGTKTPLGSSSSLLSSGSSGNRDSGGLLSSDSGGSSLHSSSGSGSQPSFSATAAAAAPTSSPRAAGPLDMACAADDSYIRSTGGVAATAPACVAWPDTPGIPACLPAPSPPDSAPYEPAAVTTCLPALPPSGGGPCKPVPSVRFSPPSPEALARWFPSLRKLAVKQPRLRVVCFHSAGNAEDMFSSEGTGARRAPSPLLEWCSQNGAEVLAVQAPGRGARMREPPCASAQDMARQVLAVLGSRLMEAACPEAPKTAAAAGADGAKAGSLPGASNGKGDTAAASASAVHVPYVVVSHSMGCWVAYEMLRLAREQGLPMPAAWFASAMPAPDIPQRERPWRQQCTLSEEQFKDECRGWDINELVFSPGMWPTYQPLLRADFTIFDEYQHSTEECGVRPFEFAIHTFWGTLDRRVKQHMVEGWRRFTTGPFTCSVVQGNHLWPLDKAAKAAWLQQVVDRLQASGLGGTRPGR